MKSQGNKQILDNLPVAVLRQRRDGSPSTTYEHGFRVGFKGNYAGSKEEKYFINNHLSFRVMYHKDLETDSARIVSFERISVERFVWEFLWVSTEILWVREFLWVSVYERVLVSSSIHHSWDWRWVYTCWPTRVLL
ncbi:unnamed protein product [Camellia sinensis]